MAEKKKHTGRNVAVGAGLVALLLLGGRMGLPGGGGGLLPGGSGTPAPAESVQATQPAETPAGSRELVIRVSGDKLLLNGEELDAAALEHRLLEDYADGAEVRLEDDQAIKAAYDEAAALLERLDIPYTEA